MEWTEKELIELYEERAAIREHDGGMLQHDAERQAYFDWRKIVGREVIVPDYIRDKVGAFRKQ